MNNLNTIKKVIYNPTFDKVILVKIEEGKTPELEFNSMEDNVMKMEMHSEAILMLVNESVVIGDL